MKKEYINMNVFDALQKRFAFLFQEFKNIYISFSGGKDSRCSFEFAAGLPE